MFAAAGVSIIDRHSDGDLARVEDLLLEGDRISNDIIMYEVRWPLVAYLDAHGPQAISETAKARLERGLAMNQTDYRSTLQDRDRIRALIASIGARVDGFVAGTESALNQQMLI